VKNKYILTKRIGIVLSLLLFLSACGGGDSSDGGGVDFSGRYIGPGTLTLSADGESESTTFAAEVIIEGNSVTVNRSKTQTTIATGTVSGDSFTAKVPASALAEFGPDCDGSVALTGTISGNMVSGTISGGQILCNGLEVTVTGTIQATKP